MHTPLSLQLGDATARQAKSRYRSKWWWWVVLAGILALMGHRLGQIQGWLGNVMIAGPSMMPTLFCPTLQGNCAHCQAVQRFPPPDDLAETLTCWNCGQKYPLKSFQFQALPGDSVWIDRAAYRWNLMDWPLCNQEPQRGDLVAIADDTGIRVKRLVAVPGDTVSLEGTELRINARPLSEVVPGPLPRIPIHESRFPAFQQGPTPHADVSQQKAPSPSHRWVKRPDGWLVYHHFSVHSKRAEPIRDDCPYNRDVTRHMNRVETFGCEATFTIEQPAEIEIACWRSSKTVSYKQSFAAGKHVVRFEQNGPAHGWSQTDRPASEIPVSETTPIAIHGLDAKADSPVKLRIDREIHWFVSEHDRLEWQADRIVLPADRFFVVGDNQPNSADSRQAPSGIERQQIIGKVSRK